VLMFQFICVGWLIFRGESVGQVFGMLGSVFSWRGTADWAFALPLAQFVLPLILFEAALGWIGSEHLHRIPRLPAFAKSAAYAMLFYLFAFHAAGGQSFIYFQF
jgi:alginate O-acetyltransferase complex protein AlgI